MCVCVCVCVCVSMCDPETSTGGPVSAVSLLKKYFGRSVGMQKTII